MDNTTVDHDGQDSNTTTVSSNLVWALSTARRDVEYPPLKCYLGDNFHEGGRIYIDGYTGKGKSMFCLGLAQAMALGTGFCVWHAAGHQSRVLYLDYEMGREEIKKRMEFFATKGLVVICFDDPELGEHGLFPIDTPDGMRQVDDLLWRARTDTVIVDNLYAACSGSLLGGGDKEGGHQAHARLVPWIREMSKRGVQTVCVQHSNENGDPYGDKRISRQMYTHLHLERLASPEDELRLKVETKKRRGGGIPKPWTARWTPGTGWGTDRDPKRDKDKLMKAFVEALGEAPGQLLPGQSIEVKAVEEVRALFYERLGCDSQGNKKTYFQRVRHYGLRDGLIREHDGKWIEVLG